MPCIFSRRKVEIEAISNFLFATDGLVFQITYGSNSQQNVVLTRVATPAVSEMMAGGSGTQLRVQAQGVGGARYVLEATPHLNSPIPWQPIETNEAKPSGLVLFTDRSLPLNAQRFYRIASP